MINIGGNYILIYPLRLGFSGAPIATSISRWAQCAMLGGYIWAARKGRIAPSLPGCKLEWAATAARGKRFLQLGAPGALMLGLMSWSFELTTVLASYLGTISLDAHMIMLNIISFTFFSFPFAIG